MSVSDTHEITRVLHNASTTLLQTILVRRPECLNSMNKFGRTLLHEVVRAENIEALTMLLLLGANPNALSRKGKTPLYYAVKVNSIAMIDILLVYNANYRQCRRVVYHRTAAFHHLFTPSVRAFHELK